ncbi:kynurenine 3-monooxygenase [Flavobacterium covae]|uniref:Kynurenine 3-monooxygenase n=1 Tax=Flavobacterium covae TaxID=2906076 RepID=A0ABW8PFY9_9FLAO|nr:MULTISPECIES: NAD(P)/FAD-dependent oxidoreductase [Flavobacterium]OXA78799.1 kynurenine 3-monooxygenase [Flavobacterium columnare] [Flavobacterium columnare NBRC 100251 = ATCC 23463]AND63457.1 kynurenine 3-monooxygenase [Flavobacterium covae]MCJ1806571.1 FAD-dependent monooxygenase [Flavobacterium covae]OWP82177.1 kynurenine 3-monooxygenase [Flavobacterium covae]POR21332.1 kynurenine 3-monooxygenase [Flavobacterium columnare]
MQTPQKIAVVGSGLVGTLLAIYLKKKGHTVHVLDRSPDIRTVEFSGRSINLVMSNRGWKALENIGIEEEIQKIGIPVDKRAIHLQDGKLNYQYYGKDGEAIFSLSRGVLNRKMIDLAEKEGVQFKFEHKIWDVSLADATLYIGETERGDWQELKYDKVFGADGAFSRIRHRMQRQSMFDYAQEFMKLGYKELHIPANSDGTHKIDKNSLHIWPRGQFMLMALANLDGSFTCTLFMPFEGENSFQSLTEEKKLVDFFAKYFPDTKEVIPDLVEDFFKNPTSYLVMMKCFPWTYKDKVALIGDSAHAIVPFYGQGMNVGFEDITILAEMIAKYGDDWKTIFEEYQNERKPNADAIAELSLRNFIEMSTKTADEKFLLQKKIEKWFSDKHPDKWLPLYSRVTFSTHPYSEALALGDLQNKIMEEIMSIPDIESKWNTEEVEQKIIFLLNT